MRRASVADITSSGTYDGHKGTVKDAVRALRYLPLTAEPRTRFQYCNTMFVGKSFYQFGS